MISHLHATLGGHGKGRAFWKYRPVCNNTIVQGIRRVIAVTASEAEEAVSKAEGLTKAMDAVEKLDASKLDAEIAGLRQV